jgi:hypothetical protein
MIENLEFTDWILLNSNTRLRNGKRTYYQISLRKKLEQKYTAYQCEF